MATQERQYMARPIEETEEGVEAASEAEAAKILRFACPTQAADGKWYRTTLAVSNVPVLELYNILAQANCVARSLRGIAQSVGGDAGNQIERDAAKIEGLHDALKRRDRVDTPK